MNKHITILFTATFSAPFISSDRSFVERNFSVHSVTASGISAFMQFLRFLPSAEITFSWFASVYSSILVFLARLTGKRSILVLGGVDVAKLPDARYGIWNSRWKSVIVRYGITHANVVLAVDSSIKNDAVTLAKYDGRNISVLPTGHDSGFWRPSGTSRTNSVLTVAACDSQIRFKVKGIDFLYAVARSMPETTFVLIGMSETMRRSTDPPANIEIHPPMPQEQLLPFYRSAKVYLQPSLREALGSTLCEAMLCECFPVGTNAGGIPTVIGAAGRVIPFGDTSAAAAAIREGMAIGSSTVARERIMENFSIEQRETALMRIITQLHEN